MVVPIFSPSTNMMPWSIWSTPVEQRVMVMAMMAADDCTQRVSTVPITRKSRLFQMVGALKLAKKACTASAYSPANASAPVVLRVLKPRKRKAMPKRKSPTMRRLFIYIRMMPMKKAKYAKSPMLNENPSDIIHAVTVVPMWAPMMTEMACNRVSSPALTKLTVISVVAVLDCTAAVTNMPVNMPVKRLVVIAPSTWRS